MPERIPEEIKRARSIKPEKAKSWRESTLTGMVLSAEEQFWGGLQPKGAKALELAPPDFVPAKIKQEALKEPTAKGMASGFVASFESIVRPDIPTPSGYAVTKTIGLFSRKHELAAQQMRKELEKLPLGYTLGELAGEAVQAYALGKVTEKAVQALLRRVSIYKIPKPLRRVLVREEKVVTKRLDIYPRKEPYRWLAKEPSRTMLMPLEKSGKSPTAFKVTVTSGPKTPLKKTLMAVTTKGQTALVKAEAKGVKTLIARAVPREALEANLIRKSVLRSAVQTVAKPSKIVSGVASTSAFLRSPYGRVVEEVEYEYYTMPGEVSRLAPSQPSLKEITSGIQKVKAHVGGALKPIEPPKLKELAKPIGVPKPRLEMFEVEKTKIKGQADGVLKPIGAPRIIDLPEPQIPKPKPIQVPKPTVTPKPSIPKPIQIPKPKPIQVPRFVEQEKPVVEPKPVVTPKPPIQIPKVVQVPRLVSVSKSITKTEFLPPRLKPKKRKGKKREFVGGWFIREWPIPTPSQLFDFGKKRKRKKKGRKKRK